MCGITGFLTVDHKAKEFEAKLPEAVARLEHRGPDDEGIYTGGGVGLGFRRLSILDLSDRAHQPMVSRDGRLVMIFNGEVYNFADVRKELLAAGDTFVGTGDTEVILAAFSRWGTDALKRFIGMFGIALWDTRERTLTLVRDRVGVKPLYYGWDGESLWFGSELKALRAFDHWKPEIDLAATGEYFQYGYISSSRSIYKSVRKLLPGHHLTLKPGGEPKVECYWTARDAGTTPLTASDDAIEAELETLMSDAFRLRMVSDVPVGVYLSGGVDSSVVTALLAKDNGHDIRTFTIGFKEAERDESVWAKKVAQHLGTDHTEYILGVSEGLEIARNWGELFDEPFGDASGMPTLLVSKLAAREVKVVLSADGGDELFSGYSVYPDVLEKAQRLSDVPGWVRAASRSGLAHVPVGALDTAMSSLSVSADGRGYIGRRVKRLRAMLDDATPSAVYDATVSYWLPEDVRRLLGHYDPPRESLEDYRGELADQMSLWDFHNYLPEDILAKVDRTTMSVSIEGREPMLDHRLCEYAFRLPMHLRRGQLGSKHIVKKILYKHVPRELVDRPKQGFAIPLDSWLRKDLRELVHDYLAEDRIRHAGILKPKVVRKLVDDFYNGSTHVTSELWFVLAFEMWRERWGVGSA